MPQRRDAAEQVGGHGHRPSERRRGECNSRYGHRQEGGAGPAHAGAQRARRRLARRLPPPSRDGPGGQPALGLRPAGRGVRRWGERHHPRIFRHHIRGLALPARGPLRQRGVWGFHGSRGYFHGFRDHFREPRSNFNGPGDIPRGPGSIFRGPKDNDPTNNQLAGGRRGLGGAGRQAGREDERRGGPLELRWRSLRPHHQEVVGLLQPGQNALEVQSQHADLRAGRQPAPHLRLRPLRARPRHPLLRRICRGREALLHRLGAGREKDADATAPEGGGRGRAPGHDRRGQGGGLHRRGHGAGRPLLL